MLQVNIEIVPFGVEDHPRRRDIGTLKIGLQRVDPGNMGQYISAMTTDGHHQPPNPVVRIEDHARDLGAFELVRRALEAHLDPDDPGRLTGPAASGFMAALAAQNDDELVKIPDGGSVSTVSTTQEAVAEHCKPELPAVLIECPACDNADRTQIIAVEYPYGHPYRYDGISEYRCPCGCRWGRWTERILEDGEWEKPFGRA